MKTNNPTFTKLYTQIMSMSTIGGNAKLLLTFIISHIENKQKFLYTNEDLMERLSVDSLSTMKRIIKELSDEELISTIVHKNFHINEKNWGNRREIFLTEKTTNIINGTYKKIETAAPIEIIEVIETTQPEEKAPQIKEKVSIIEGDEEIPLEISALENLKEILDNQYPMKTDIERQLMIIAKNSSSYQINELYKKIKSDKIKSDSIEEFLENNIN